MRTSIQKGLAAGSLGALLLGTVGLAPARADRYDQINHAVRRDIDAIHHDQTHVRDLERRLDDQRYNRDGRGVRRTQTDLDHARLDLDRDRELLRLDQRELGRYGRWR